MILADKTVIVTGASSGIGAAAAHLFAAEGANLVLAARRESSLLELADRIAQKNARPCILTGDVQDEAYAKALVDCAETAFGGLDAAFNNAGITGALGSVQDMSAETWRQVIDTNLTSAFLAVKYQIPAMLRRGSGSIVLTSSFVGHTIGLPGMAAYAASKAGLIGLTQVLAAEHGPAGIRVNALLPGGTKTAMAGDDPDHLRFIEGLHALKRMAEPVEIAHAAMFLLSDNSSFVTGSAMIADGGNSISKV